MSNVYAEVGGNFQQVGGDCPDGWIVMQSERPSPDHVAAEDGSWILRIVVPDKVSMRQARLAMLSAGLLDDVEAAISAMPGDQGKAARIEWDYSSEVFRDKPFVQQIGAQLNLTDEQIDQLFITAAGIE